MNKEQANTKTIVLDEKGRECELPPGNYLPVGHVEPGAQVRPSDHDRKQCGFWGQAPGPSGYYAAYYWNAQLQRAFFPVGCRYASSHMQPEIGKAALRVASAREELRESERALAALTVMKTTIQIDRYLTAITLPDGRIYRHSKSATGGGSMIERWGCVPAGIEESCGWGEARHIEKVLPETIVEISTEDLSEIVRQADSGEDPKSQSTADWYMNHVPYWGGINDGNRVVEKHGARPDVANRAEELFRRYCEAVNAPA